MISWLPVAVVLLAVAVALLATIATPTIAQPSEPPPAGERLGLVGGIALVKVKEEDKLGDNQAHQAPLIALNDDKAGKLSGNNAQSIHDEWIAAATSNHTTNEDDDPNHHHSEKKKEKKSWRPPTKAEEAEEEDEELKLKAAIKPHQLQNQLKNQHQIEQTAEEAAKAQLMLSPTNSLTSRSLIYTNQFVIQVEGGELEARKLALKHGFVYLNHILGDYYHLEHQRLSKRSTSATKDALNISIEDEPQVSCLMINDDAGDLNNNQSINRSIDWLVGWLFSVVWLVFQGSRLIELVNEENISPKPFIFFSIIYSPC